MASAWPIRCRCCTCPYFATGHTAIKSVQHSTWYRVSLALNTLGFPNWRPTSSSAGYVQYVPHNHVPLQGKFKWLPCSLHVRWKYVYFFELLLWHHRCTQRGPLLQLQLLHFMFHHNPVHLVATFKWLPFGLHVRWKKKVYFLSCISDTIGASKGAHFLICRLCTICST